MKKQESVLNRNRLLIYFTYGLCALIWGTGWYAIRLSVSTGGYPVFGGAAIRYTLAAVILGMLVSFFPRTVGVISRRQIGWLSICGLMNAAGTALLYWGERSISGGLAAVLIATSPIMVALLALVSRTERITRGTILGFVVALIGIGVIFSERLTVSPSHLFAMLAMLGAALFFALSSWLMKIKANDVKPLVSSTLFFFSMSVFCWLACPCESAAIPWPPPAVPTYALLYLSIACSVLAFPAYVFLLRNASLMIASSLAFVHPVIALLTDCMLERNFALTCSAYIGIFGVLFGVVLSMMASNRSTLIANRKTADSLEQTKSGSEDAEPIAEASIYAFQRNPMLNYE